MFGPRMVRRYNGKNLGCRDRGRPGYTISRFVWTFYREYYDFFLTSCLEGPTTVNTASQSAPCLDPRQVARCRQCGGPPKLQHEKEVGAYDRFTIRCHGAVEAPFWELAKRHWAGTYGDRRQEDGLVDRRTRNILALHVRRATMYGRRPGDAQRHAGRNKLAYLDAGCVNSMPEPAPSAKALAGLLELERARTKLLREDYADLRKENEGLRRRLANQAEILMDFQVMRARVRDAVEFLRSIGR